MIRPVERISQAFINLQRIVKNRRRILKQPFQKGDRVDCIGFEGKVYRGTVVSCMEIDNGYTCFIRVEVRLDVKGVMMNFNWSLFPDRIKKAEV